MENIKYLHDCPDCLHVGGDSRHDYYFCANLEQQSLVARHGDHPAAYMSMPAFILKDMTAGHLYSCQPYSDILRLARARGLVAARSAA